MDKTLFQEYDEEKRRQMLEDNAEAVEELEYYKRLDGEELQELKDLLSDLSVQLNKLEAEKKEYNDYYKNEMKPIQRRVGNIISELKTQSRLVEERCYKFVDEEEGQTLYYNEKGELVKFRSIHPQEKQKNIFRLNSEEKTGTND